MSVGLIPRTRFICKVSHNQFTRLCFRLYSFDVRTLTSPFLKQGNATCTALTIVHKDIMTWTRCLHYWAFVRGSHQVESPQKGRCFYLTFNNCWINNRITGGWDSLALMWPQSYIRPPKEKISPEIFLGISDNISCVDFKTWINNYTPTKFRVESLVYVLFSKAD